MPVEIRSSTKHFRKQLITVMRSRKSPLKSTGDTNVDSVKTTTLEGPVVLIDCPGGRVVWLPLPPRGCSSNVKSRWVKSDAVSLYREECKLAFLAEKIGSLDKVDISINYHNGGSIADGRYRPTDEPNAIDALKPAFDAMQDAGIIPNDNHHHLHINGIQLWDYRKSKSSHQVSGVQFCIKKQM